MIIQQDYNYFEILLKIYFFSLLNKEPLSWISWGVLILNMYIAHIVALLAVKHEKKCIYIFLSGIDIFYLSGFYEISMEKIDGRKGKVVWDCGSPLYDSYELAELTNIIERHTTISLPVSPSRFGKDRMGSRIKDDFSIKRTKYDQKAKENYRRRFHSFCARMGWMKKWAKLFEQRIGIWNENTHIVSMFVLWI